MNSMNWPRLFHWLLTLLCALQKRVRQLERELSDCQGQFKKLQGRLALNSRNSSQPPSSDGLAKAPAPISLRQKTGRRAGGQPGHPGRTLLVIETPDHVRLHALERCPCGLCSGRSLRHQPVIGHEKRQVFELPEKLLEVTEHRAEIKVCPVSGRNVRASFPEAVSAPAQYGPRFRSAMVYLSFYQMVPHERLTQLSEDLFGQPLSEATVVSAGQRTERNLAVFEQTVRELLVQAPVVHVDETGFRVAGQLHWLHAASTTRLTFYGVHPKRGTQAMDDLDLIPRCRGWLVHDHFKPYFTYRECLHALCNQHHLRELRFLHEEQGQAWAGELSRFLRHWNQQVPEGHALSKKAFQRVHRQYRALLAKGRRLNPRQPSRAQSKAANLLTRLEDYDLSVLAFLLDPEVPFTNNTSERDMRMAKVRQKISGCFRTFEGARVFARVRSYISTCRKQKQNILQALCDAFLGKPFMPTAASSARAP